MCGHKKSSGSKSTQQTAVAAPTPAVSVSAPTSESAVTSNTVMSEAQVQQAGAKGKKRLTVNLNGMGTGVNF